MRVFILAIVLGIGVLDYTHGCSPEYPPRPHLDMYTTLKIADLVVYGEIQQIAVHRFGGMYTRNNVTVNVLCVLRNVNNVDVPKVIVIDSGDIGPGLCIDSMYGMKQEDERLVQIKPVAASYFEFDYVNAQLAHYKASHTLSLTVMERAGFENPASPSGSEKDECPKRDPVATTVRKPQDFNIGIMKGSIVLTDNGSSGFSLSKALFGVIVVMWTTLSVLN